MENVGTKQDYEALPQKNGKASRNKKRVKRERPVSPDSRDADTEQSESELNELPGFEKEDSGNQENNRTQFSTQRRICLVGSLLLCVFTIFAFAFILPCHHKSCAKDKDCGHKPLKHWSKNFTGMTPLVLREFNDGKYIQGNLLVGYKFPGNRNTSCPESHCQGVLSVKGCNGKSLWRSHIDGPLGKVQCMHLDHARKKNNFQEGSGCFVQEGNDKIVFIDTENGNKKWRAEHLGTVRSFRTIPDINGDRFQDILLLHASRDPQGASWKRENNPSRNTLRVLSGKSGRLMGQSVIVSTFPGGISTEHVFLRVHRVSASLHYILIGIKPESANTGTLLAIEVQDLSNRVHNSSTRRRTTPWGSNKPNEFGFIELFQDTLVLAPPLFADLNKDGIEDVVLCSFDKGITVRALNGKNAVEFWSRRLTVGGRDSALPSLVSLGNHVIDVAVMVKLSNQSSRIVVLNGRNGSVRWLFTLTNPLPVPPVGVPKTDGIPVGLLLWLPKSKVHRYLAERHRKYHGNDDTARKTKDQKKKRGGPRRRRELSDDDDDDGMVDDVIRDLLAMMDEGDDGKSRDEGEEHVVDDINDDEGGDDGNDNVVAIDFEDDDDKLAVDDDDDKLAVDDDDDKLAVDDDDDKLAVDDDDDKLAVDDDDKLAVDDDDKLAVDDDDDNTSQSNGGSDVIAEEIVKESNHHKDDKEKDKEHSGGVTDVDNRPYSHSAKLNNPTDDRWYPDGVMPDNPARHRPDSDNTNPDNPNDHIIHPNPTLHSDQTAMSEQTRSVEYEALRNFLRNWKNNLQPEQQSQATKHSTGLPTPSTRIESFNESPNTEDKNQKKQKIQSSSSSEISPVQKTGTISVNTTKRESLMGKGNDKSLLLACDKQAKDLSRELSVVLVYRDEKRRRLQVMEVTEDDIISLGPHEYKKQFGKPPPTANCQHFIPNVRSRPLVKDIDGDGRLDLIYVLEYHDTIAHGHRNERFMKVKKLDILDAILTKKSNTNKYSGDESKSSKRNERFDSPFAQWKID